MEGRALKALVITGASSGIGAATARRFAADGYRVVNLSRRPSPVDGVHSVAVDLGATDWTETAAAELSEQLPRGAELVVIHNAARLTGDDVQTLSPDDFRAVLEVNVTAPLLLNQLCLPYMASGSAIVYVGSTLSEKAVAGAAAYVTSKHALAGLMRATCQDLAGRGIHTALVCPGFTNTEMLRAHLADPDVLQAVGGNNAFSRLVDPDEVAATLFFAATNPVVNGSVIHANLGQIER
ncbi:MAG: SDR family oxidoreductase [Pseudomonadota bacterium]